jgi:hypothetical protein
MNYKKILDTAIGHKTGKFPITSGGSRELESIFVLGGDIGSVNISKIICSLY